MSRKHQNKWLFPPDKRRAIDLIRADLPAIATIEIDWATTGLAELLGEEGGGRCVGGGGGTEVADRGRTKAVGSDKVPDDSNRKIITS